MAMRKNWVEVTPGALYGRWRILAPSIMDDKGIRRVQVECICNDAKPEVQRETHVVALAQLVGGYSKSCGCIRDEVAKKRMTTHGMTGTQLNDTWKTTRRRAKTSGVAFSSSWDTFQGFVDWSNSHGYVEGRRFCRKDPKGPFTPENCEWRDRVSPAAL